MMRQQKLKQLKTTNGGLNNQVVFAQTGVASGLHKRESVTKELFHAWADIYNPSLKDIEILKGRGVKKSLSLVIRDPLGAYCPDNKHVVKILSANYPDDWWKIEVIRFKDGYITFVLSGDANGA